jgi:hypothetical protein
MKRNISETMFTLMDELDMYPETTMITVQRKDLELLVKEMLFKGDEWSNQACLGYMEKSAIEIGVDEEIIRDIANYMKLIFDDTSVEEAAKYYRQS